MVAVMKKWRTVVVKKWRTVETSGRLKVEDGFWGRAVTVGESEV
jgi:hypothetical protein